MGSRVARVALGLLVVSVPLGVNSASAQQADNNAAAFGVKAALFGKTELNRGHFAFALPRGATVHDAAEVINYTDEPLTLNVFGADVVTADGGGALAPLRREDEMHHVGKWLTLDEPEQATLQLAPRARTTVPFSVTVPGDARTGDFPGALVVSKPAPDATGRINSEVRVALLVDLSVPGTTNVAAHVAAPRARRVGRAYRMTVEVANSGNVLLTVRGKLEIRDGRRVVARLALSPSGIYVIPGGKTTLRATWEDPPVFGRRNLVAHVRTYLDDEYQKTFASDATSVTILPWRGIGVALAVLVVLGGLAFLNRRRIGAWLRRRRENKEILRRYREATQ